MENEGSLDGGLGVCKSHILVFVEAQRRAQRTELSGERDLKENVLHDAVRRDDGQEAASRVGMIDELRSVRSLELEGLATEEDIVESPGLGGEDGRNTHLSSLDEEGEVNSSRDGISSGPRLSGSGVGSVSVSSEGLSIDKGLRDDVDDLVSVKTKEFGDNGGGGDLDEAVQSS